MVLVFNVPPRCPSNFSGRTSGDDLKYEMPVCWNWQTRRTQNPLMATSCGFDPRHRHHTEIPNFLEMRGLGFFILSVSINKSGAEKFLENKIHECEKGAVGRICPLILDTQYWGYIRMKNRTARFSGFRGVNFFDGFKVEHRNLALSHSIETL